MKPVRTILIDCLNLSVCQAKTFKYSDCLNSTSDSNCNSESASAASQMSISATHTNYYTTSLHTARSTDLTPLPLHSLLYLRQSGMTTGVRNASL